MIALELLNHFYCYHAGDSLFYEITKEEYEQLQYSQSMRTDNGIQHIVCTMKHLEQFLHGNMRGLVLKITDLCNMNCSYCPHAQSENPYMKHHANNHMSEDIAYKGIDYLYQNSSELDAVDIIFFGGEPLIEFRLIQKIVYYAEERLSGKDITFNLTTNTTLLNDEMITFFSQHKFCVCVSLDGPKEVHNLNRKNKGGKGTFDDVLLHFKKLKKAFRGTDSTVRINGVVDERCDLREIERFFASEAFDCVPVDLNPIDYTGSILKPEENLPFAWETEYVKFLVNLCILGKIPRQMLPIMADSYFKKMKSLYDRMKCIHKKLPDGRFQMEYDYCANGFFAFLNPEGRYFPGVYVNEKNEALIVGDVDSGIHAEWIENILKTCSDYRKHCQDCFYLFDCDLPISLCIEAKGDSIRLWETHCDSFSQLWKETANLILFEYILNRGFSERVMPSEKEKGDVSAVITQLIKQFKDVVHASDLQLLSTPDGLLPIELVYLVYQLEEILHIAFEPKDFIDFRFCTMQNIKEITEEVLRRG